MDVRQLGNEFANKGRGSGQPRRLRNRMWQNLWSRRIPSHRSDQSFDLSGQRGTAHRKLERPQDSIVLPVSISCGQPVGSVGSHGPLKKLHAMRRGFDPSNRCGGAAEADAVNVDVEVVSQCAAGSLD